MEYDCADGTQRRQKLIALKSTQIFLFAGVILLSMAITVLCLGFLVRYERKTDVLDADRVAFWHEKLTKEQRVWFDDGIAEMRDAFKVNWKFESARNVVIFMIHGVGIAAQAAARYNGKSSRVNNLIWENFEHLGHIIQPCNTSMPCDAHSIATGLYSGIRATNDMGVLDSSVHPENCDQSMNESRQVKSLIRLAQQRNLRTGFVTTRRVSGPTMAALYANTPDPTWECDSNIPARKVLQGCRDIATQLIDDETGRSINVIMGGGRQALVSKTFSSDWDPLEVDVCNSADGRNYLREWRTFKMLNKQKFALLQSGAELSRMNGTNVDYVMGVFSNGNIKPPWRQDFFDNHMPKLNSMVTKALEVLRRPQSGYLLIVESENDAEDILEEFNELSRLNNTITEISKYLSSDTLMVVALYSGHSESKYLEKSLPSLGDELMDDKKLESLGHINTYAKGPSSYLLHGIYEETYLAQAVSFALKMGQFQERTSKDT